MSTGKRVLAPVATFVVIGALALGLTLLGGGTTPGRYAANPPVLHLAQSMCCARSMAAQLSADGAYRLVGALPRERPADMPVWELSPAGVTNRLAKALGGAPTVDASGQWWWSTCGGTTVSSSAPTACAVSAGGVAVAPAPAPAPGRPGRRVPNRFVPPPVEVTPVATAGPDTVRRAAFPIFEALGLDAARAKVDGTSAVLDPAVGGFPTVGYATRVSVAPDGRITDASGWLTSVSHGDRYPLLTAQQAFAALPSPPRPMMMCPVGRDRKGCGPFPPVEITGAHLGLAVRPFEDGTRNVLVPAWLFDVKGSQEPVVGIAVEPRYVDDGTNPTSPVPVPPGAGVPANPARPVAKPPITTVSPAP